MVKFPGRKPPPVTPASGRWVRGGYCRSFLGVGNVPSFGPLRGIGGVEQDVEDGECLKANPHEITKKVLCKYQLDERISHDSE